MQCRLEYVLCRQFRTFSHQEKTAWKFENSDFFFEKIEILAGNGICFLGKTTALDALYSKCGIIW